MYENYNQGRYILANTMFFLSSCLDGDHGDDDDDGDDENVISGGAGGIGQSRDDQDGAGDGTCVGGGVWGNWGGGGCAYRYVCVWGGCHVCI